MKHRVRKSLLQDRDITTVSSDGATQRVYVTLHFVTAEFDYHTGKRFVNQLLSHLERIAPASTPQHIKT